MRRGASSWFSSAWLRFSLQWSHRRYSSFCSPCLAPSDCQSSALIIVALAMITTMGFSGSTTVLWNLIRLHVGTPILCILISLVIAWAAVSLTCFFSIVYCRFRHRRDLNPSVWVLMALLKSTELPYLCRMETGCNWLGFLSFCCICGRFRVLCRRLVVSLLSASAEVAFYTRWIRSLFD